MRSKKSLVENKKESSLVVFAIIILVVGLLIGGGIITTGVIKTIQTNNKLAEIKTADVVQDEINKVNDDLSKLKKKQNDEFDKSGFSDEFYDIGDKIEDLTEDKKELIDELDKINNGHYDKLKEVDMAPVCIFGVLIIVVSLIISVSMYLFYKNNIMMNISSSKNAKQKNKKKK